MIMAWSLFLSSWSSLSLSLFAAFYLCIVFLHHHFTLLTPRFPITPFLSNNLLYYFIHYIISHALYHFIYLIHFMNLWPACNYYGGGGIYKIIIIMQKGRTIGHNQWTWAMEKRDERIENYRANKKD